VYHRYGKRGHKGTGKLVGLTGLSGSATVTAVACALNFLEMQGTNQAGTGLWTVDTAQ
jgi:hypothetical protein